MKNKKCYVLIGWLGLLIMAQVPGYSSHVVVQGKNLAGWSVILKSEFINRNPVCDASVKLEYRKFEWRDGLMKDFEMQIMVPTGEHLNIPNLETECNRNQEFSFKMDIEYGYGETFPKRTLVVTKDGYEYDNEIFNVQEDPTSFGISRLNITISDSPQPVLGPQVPQSVPESISHSGNLFINGYFEDWSSGTTSAPDKWAFDGLGGAVERFDISLKAVAKLTAIDNCRLQYRIDNSLKTIANYWKGKTLTFKCWVYATKPNTTKLEIYDNKGRTSSDYHPGDSNWHLLTVTRTVNSAASMLYLFLSTTDNTTSYFSGAMCAEGNF